MNKKVGNCYETTCDYCGRVIAFPAKRPTLAGLAAYGAIVRGRKVYCSKQCAAEANHDAAVKRAGNLKQFQPGKKFKRI